MGASRSSRVAGQHLEEILWRLMCRILLDLLQLSSDLKDSIQVTLIVLLILDEDDPDDFCHLCHDWHQGPGSKKERESSCIAIGSNCIMPETTCTAAVTSHHSVAAVSKSTHKWSPKIYQEFPVIQSSSKFTFAVCWIVCMYLCNWTSTSHTVLTGSSLSAMVETKTTSKCLSLCMWGMTSNCFTNSPKSCSGIKLAKEGNATRQRVTGYTVFKRIPNFVLSVKTVESFALTSHSRLLILCYEFFSITYASGVPVLDYLAQPKAKLKRGVTVGAVQIPLYGSPNQGYCAMIAIGLEHTQKASSSYTVV